MTPIVALRRVIASRSRLMLAGLALALAAGLAAVGALSAGRGAPTTGNAVSGFLVVGGGQGLLATTRATLIAELRAEALHWTDVACVANGRHFEGHPIVRCNVDFGDPHIQAYCTVIADGRLVTNYNNPAIPCRQDDAGFQIITYPDYLAHRGSTTSR